MLPNEIEQCPHCGSKAGYYYKITQTYEQSKGFGNDIDDDIASCATNVKHSACRCESCRKIIKRD